MTAQLKVAARQALNVLKKMHGPVYGHGDAYRAILALEEALTPKKRGTKVDQSLVDRARSLRERGMTYQQIAAEIGKSQRTAENYCKGYTHEY